MNNEELKTLKDIEFLGITNYTEYQKEKIIEEIKTEAIKHIKHLSKKYDEFNSLTFDGIVWIKNFFNITEDELE